MKAKDLKPGDTVDGWTVKSANPGGMMLGYEHNPATGQEVDQWDEVVLLTLGREWSLGEPGSATRGKVELIELRGRTWMRADEEVTP